MEIVYLDNSGFCVFLDNTTLIFDYYNVVPSGEKLSIDHGVITDKEILRNKNTYVFSSHKHEDHYNDCVLKWQKQNGNIKYIFDDGIVVHKKKMYDNINFLDEGDIFDDENIFVKAFGSTDIGGSFLVKAEGYTLFHAGDLNFWHWEQEASDRFVDRAKKRFLSKLKNIEQAKTFIDIMFFPVDYRMGNNGDTGAKMVIESFKPSLFIPMHFRKAIDKIAVFKQENQNSDTMIWAIKNRGDVLHFI